MRPGSRLEQDTAALALPEGRRVGRPGHDVARRYLLGRMAEIGLVPFRGGSLELPFRAAEAERGRTLDFTNLAGVIRGAEPGLPPVLVGAHYDSVIDAPCADDNATAVAVALAVAERFAGGGLRRDLIVALFDSEEPPYFLTPAMGSKRFYEDHCGDTDFAGVVIMDLIGHDVEIAHPGARLLPGLKKLLFVLGAESDGALPGVVEHVAGRTKGLRIFPTLNRYIGDLSDHHAFRLGGQPFLFLSCGQGRNYHLPQDDLRWINFRKVRRVFEFVAGLVERLDSTETTGRPCDPVELEIRMIGRAVGPALPLLLAAAGLGPLRDRDDLDRLAAVVAGLVG